MITQKPRTKTKREKSTSTVGHYVRNADLLPAIIEAKEEGKVTNKLIMMIRIIADNYSRKGNFVNYSFREDMVSSAVENLCKNALKFDHLKYTNPFSYYTSAIHNSFLQYIAIEKKHLNIRDALLIDAGSNPSFNYMQPVKDEADFDIKESDEVYIPEVTADGSTATTATPEEDTIKEERIGHRDRVPSPVKRYGPGNFKIDPVTGAFILNDGE